MNGPRRRLLLAMGAALAGAHALHAQAASATHTVTIDGFEFKPLTLTVKQGDVVVWHNADPVPHTATAVDRHPPAYPPSSSIPVTTTPLRSSRGRTAASTSMS